MPIYVYKAMDKTGYIVRNRVEDVSKNALIKKLKSNQLEPIEIVKLNGRRNKANRNKKNIKNICWCSRLSDKILPSAISPSLVTDVFVTNLL